MSNHAAAVEHIFHVGWVLWHCVHCFNCKAVQRDREVGMFGVLAKERETSSAFIFASRGNRDDLVHVVSSLLSPAVKAATGESLRSRPLSSSMNRSVFLHRPVSLGRASSP